jgi:hypothetical protein
MNSTIGLERHGANATKPRLTPQEIDRRRAQTAPAPTHEQIMLAYANEILKYESAQANLHFAFIGSDSPCPCDDCRHIEVYPGKYSVFAREVVRANGDWYAERERIAQDMLAAGHEQNPQAFRLLDRVNDAIEIGKLHEATGIEGEQGEESHDSPYLESWERSVAG